jgi:hypothetical protein
MLVTAIRIVRRSAPPADVEAIHVGGVWTYWVVFHKFSGSYTVPF